MEKSLSIVIITRNTRDLVKDLLGSIVRDDSLVPRLSEIVIVDNGSHDGTRETLEAMGVDLCYVYNELNLGFAAAVNVGWKKAKGFFVLFLNSDTILVPGSVVRMLDFMNMNDSVAICGPQLVHHDFRQQRSAATPPSLLFEVVPRSLWERRSVFHGPLKGITSDAPLSVDSLVGAAIVVRRTVLANLAGFDEQFFFFLEETDFCIRARKAGYDVMFVPEAKIVHLQGRTVAKKWVSGRIEYNISLYKFIRKYHGPFYYRAFQSLRVVKSMFFVLLLTCFFPVVLIRPRTKRSYLYYTHLLAWHLHGCPDQGGLKATPPE